MKKLGLLLAVFALAACSSGAKTTSGEGTSTNDKGDVTTAKVTLEDGKITKVEIDTLQKDAEKTKKELGADYGMKVASSIGKEWNEQIESLEKYIVANGVDAIKIDEKGYPSEDDVKAGCTMKVNGYIEAVNNAVKAAK